MKQRIETAILIIMLLASLLILAFSLAYSNSGAAIVFGLVSALMIRVINARLGRSRSRAKSEVTKARFVGYALLGFAVAWILIAPMFITVSRFNGMLIFLGVGLFFLAIGGIFLLASDTLNVLAIWHSRSHRK